MRKFISGIVSLSLAATTVVASVASGAFNPYKDPNGDGHLTLADAAYIYQCLDGVAKPSNLSQLDVDDNDVVSDVDAILVQRHAAGLSTMSLMGGDELNSVAANDTSTDYAIFDAKTGVYKRSYSLSVTNDDNSNIASPNAVFGTDDRIPDWSNRGAAKIRCSEDNIFRLSSGFVVGRHTIATAAHVVFNTEKDQARKVIKILLFDEDQTDHSVTPKEYHIPRTFMNATKYTTIDDYALITVEEDLSDYMSFNLGEITDTADDHQITVSTVGFPKYINPGLDDEEIINSSTEHDERLSTGSITDVYSKKFHFTADISGGNSGGPIYVVESVNGVTYHTVIGITVAEDLSPYPSYNVGVRFDASILKFFKGNPNIQY